MLAKYRSVCISFTMPDDRELFDAFNKLKEDRGWGNTQAGQWLIKQYVERLGQIRQWSEEELIEALEEKVGAVLITKLEEV